MKDLIEARFTIATREFNGRAFKVVGKQAERLLTKLEPQINRVIEVFIKELEEEKEKKTSQ